LYDELLALWRGSDPEFQPLLEQATVERVSLAEGAQ